MTRMTGTSLGIDPGPITSGVVLFDHDRKTVLWCDQALRNSDLLELISTSRNPVCMEVVKAIYSGHVGAETIATIRFTGRIMQLASSMGLPLHEFSPQEIKKLVCHAPNAKDPAVRQALIDFVGPVGTRKAPGPCFGVAKHAWRALAAVIAAHLSSTGDLYFTGVSDCSPVTTGKPPCHDKGKVGR